MSELKNRAAATIATVVASAAIMAGVALGTTTPPSASPAAQLAATTPSAESPDAPGLEREGDDGADSREVAGSESASESGNESDGSAAEKAASAKLATQAKVTEQQARNTALARTPGSVSGSEIGDQNGTITWQVDITAADGKEYEVQVDAATGAVLASAANDND